MGMGFLFQKQLIVEMRRQGETMRAVASIVMEEQETTAASTEPTVATVISSDRPVFVLSLPNSADLVIPRYLECAGYNQTTMGRHWASSSLQGKKAPQ